MRRLLLTVLVAASLLAGCGGDDNGGSSAPVDRPTQTKLTAIDARLNKEGAKVFDELKKHAPSAAVTAKAKALVTAYASEEQKAVAHLGKLTPPEDIGSDVQKWGLGLNAQAEALAAALKEPGLTGQRLTETILGSSPQEGIKQLREKGYVPPAP
jgi:hypothetical protein